MKRTLLLIAVFIFALSYTQESKIIKLNQNIKDPYSQTKSLTLFDIRKDKNIGTYTLPENKGVASVVFPENSQQAFKDWFDKYNKVKGQDELILLIKDLKIVETDSIENAYGYIKFDLSTYLKKKDGFHFINRYKTIYNVYKDPFGTSNKFPFEISYYLWYTIKNSYEYIPRENPITESELNDYEKVIVESMPVFKNNQSIDGIYKDSYSFFYQIPETGNFQIKKDQDGMFHKAYYPETRKTLFASEIFAYVENGVIYKKTFSGYEKLLKDNNGFYIFSNKAFVAPESPNYGGSLTGAVLTQQAIKRAEKEPKYNIYIDSLTGKYIFKN